MEATFIVDPQTGALTVEGFDPSDTSLFDELLSGARELNCARPLNHIVDATQLRQDGPGGPRVRISRLWHNSAVEGPGRRSVLQMQGCYFACPGCFASETWDFEAGVDVSVSAVVDALLDPAYERSGTSILGGEPFAQPDALLAIVTELKRRGQHVLVYTGWTIEKLQKRASRRSGVVIAEILENIDVLIDGRYVEALSAGNREYMGSSNQRYIEHPSRWNNDARQDGWGSQLS